MTAVNADTREQSLSEIVRSVHRVYASGVTIVTALDGETPHGLAVSAFCSVSLDPPTIMVLVSFTSSNHARFYSQERLGVNIVSAEQAGVLRQFGAPGEDKFRGVDWHKGKFGTPVLDKSSGFFEMEVEQRILAHTHTIFIGRVLHAGVRQDAPPLVYFNGSFHDGGKLVELEEGKAK
ncbi:flavin reductase family protein [Mesorhizobium sp. M1329]|uniref:flavin reductase family protein n=1 Tax=Mesorhizobium sp. M1329 TaxID=2957083 RepID=UPI003338DB5C